jgi:hypothetical protein
MDYSTKGMVRSCGLRLDSARTLTPFYAKQRSGQCGEEVLIDGVNPAHKSQSVCENHMNVVQTEQYLYFKSTPGDKGQM